MNSLIGPLYDKGHGVYDCGKPVVQFLTTKASFTAKRAAANVAENSNCDVW